MFEQSVYVAIAENVKQKKGRNLLVIHGEHQ